jgi:hypothetical protein
MFRNSDCGLSRRELIRLASAGALAASSSGWLERLARAAEGDKQRKRACILLWMSGGPSQIDTFDPKPDHANGGPFKPRQTAVPGLSIGEHLPLVAEQIKHLAVVRSLTSKEGDHGQATYFVRNGYVQRGAIRYPTLGSLLAKELGDSSADLPNFVSINSYRAINPAAFSPGFLGPRFAPLLVGDRQAIAATNPSGDNYELKVEDLEAPSDVKPATASARLELVQGLNSRFLEGHSGSPGAGYKTAYERAVKLMRSSAASAFKLDDEPAKLREAYGRNAFGQGCLLARRLVERGVAFVEVTLAGVDAQGILGWDTHIDNFEGVRRLCQVLDPAWATLLTDLQSRGLLETTTVVWMGEFGRTPQINPSTGRDHYPQAWSAVLGGGGVKGGQVIGRTSKDGTTVEERPVKVPDFLATVCEAVGVDPTTQNPSNAVRPIRIVDPEAAAISEALA